MRQSGTSRTSLRGQRSKHLFLPSLLFLLGAILFVPNASLAQPQSLRSDVQINMHLNVANPSSCIGYDKVENKLYYGNVSGNIYKVITGTPNTNILMFDTLDHDIKYLQGMIFHDSSLFLIGNDWGNGTEGIGIVKKGKLQPNGTRVWTTVLETVPYPATNATFDHGFSGITIDPTGQYIYISSGSRTDHGETQTAGGVFPTTREVPLTSAIFRVPITTENLLLPNNDTLLTQGGWLFADGTRNTFSLAFNGRGDLFGLENSGDRDDSEEMNRLQQGQHYGFPWRMGESVTPQQFPGYNPALDKLANPNSKAYSMGYFYDDPTYPAAPSVTFTDALENVGPHANYYRNATDGKIYQSATTLKTFTTHRSPLGLVIDRDSVLAAPFRGSAFMLSFTQGNGDSTGYSPSSIWGLPVVPIDSSEDLIHLDMMYDQGTDSYSLVSTRIIGGFNLPVDAVMVDTVLYALEYGSAGNRHIWKITFPKYLNTGISTISNEGFEFKIFPNPSEDLFTLAYYNPKTADIQLSIADLLGRTIGSFQETNNAAGWNYKTIDSQKLGLTAGVYWVHFSADGKSLGSQKMIVR